MDKGERTYQKIDILNKCCGIGNQAMKLGFFAHGWGVLITVQIK